MSETSVGATTPAPPAPARENLSRGMLATLLTVPLGVAAWVLVWSLGYIAAIVGALVAFVALRLYVWGAGRISKAGAAVVLTTTLVTLVLAFFAGVVYDATVGFGDAAGLSRWEALTHPEFWPVFGQVMPEALPDYLPDFAWALGFGALGSFTTLRSAFAAGKKDVTPEAGVEPAPAYGFPGQTAAAPQPTFTPEPSIEPQPTSGPAPQPTSAQPQPAPEQS